MANILVVDDEEAIRTYVARVLKCRGLAVQTAASANEALDACDHQTFDVILSDVVMPGAMDGIALADHVTSRWPATQMVLMSGYTGACRTITYPIIQKPFTPAVIAERVVRLCEEAGNTNAGSLTENPLRPEHEPSMY